MGFKVLDMTSKNTDYWSAGGFPYGFRFRKPREVFSVICNAMAERSVALHHLDSSADTSGSRHEVQAITQKGICILDKKHIFNIGNYEPKHNMWHFMEKRIMQIAACYCDPDKAYDFENYPDLENWTPESLEDKLKEDYVRFSAFCDKEKYLLFIYKVLNLCKVRRTFAADSPVGGARRTVGVDGDGYYLYSEREKALDILKSRGFVNMNNNSHKFVVRCDVDETYSFSQYKTRFVTWVDETRPCDITFYGCALSEGIDEFSSCGVDGVKENKWFCAGTPKTFETVNGVSAAVLELEFPDSEIPAIRKLDPMTVFTTGFTLKKLQAGNKNDCYGVVVRDQSKYLKYLGR